MNRKKLIFAVAAVVLLSLAIISISYGYWTDKLYVLGDGAFEYHLPIENDINPVADEVSGEEGLFDIDDEPVEGTLQHSEIPKKGISAVSESTGGVATDDKISSEKVIEDDKSPIDDKLDNNKALEETVSTEDKISTESVEDDDSEL